LLSTDGALWALCGIYLFYLIGCFFCKDQATGLYELKKNVFWVIVPMGVALSAKLKARQFWQLMLIFVIFVTISTFIATYKLFHLEQLQIPDVRMASYVSHVSFSFQIIMSVFILFYGAFRKPQIFNKINLFLLMGWSLWLVAFMILQKSLIGILSFYFAAIIFFIWFVRHLSVQWHKAGLIILAFCFTLLPFAYAGMVIMDFYTIKDTVPSKEVPSTENGHLYAFDFDNKQKENGYYVHWYLCKEELDEAWTQRSQLSLSDRDATGYQVYYTLIRYLTSKGLKKDAAGVKALSEQDVQNIEKGIANHIFYDRRYSLYPRIYQTIWEIDEYLNTGNPNNQSLSQRFEYIKAARYIIQHHFWGIGTGNYKLEFAHAYEQIDTQLKEEFRFHVHNQYLSYMVKFGLIGLIIILFMFFYAIYFHRQFKNILLIVLLTVLFVSNFGEAILETHVGLPFFLFFIALFLWHSPDELRQSW
ncbi:MAG: O-antigen ligase family protein, partial [Prolixibacteraceae bacterium]|nr:O-antigen ligase family protein [Prolixibacteraceae bacterium]